MKSHKGNFQKIIMFQSFSKIWIVVAVAVFAVAGIFYWQYFDTQKQEIPQDTIQEKIISKDDCEKFSDLEKNQCYFNLAKETKDESYCEKITKEYPEFRGNCYAELAILKNDSSICQKVETASLSSSCWEYFGMKDWKTYRNEEYGFKVGYPDDWIMNEEILIGPCLVVSFLDEQKFNMERIEVMVQKTNYSSVTDYTEEAHGLHGIKEVELKVSARAQQFEENGKIFTAFLKDKFLYEIVLFRENQKLNKHEIEIIYNQMLSSFQFIE